MEENIYPSSSLSSPQWYAMRAYKREKQAEEALSGDQGMKHFIAKHYAVRAYHGVKSKRLVPVIPSLVFVHSTREDIVRFKKTYNYLQFMKHDRGSSGDYIIVPNKQMDDFIRVVSLQMESTTVYSPDEIDIQKGTPVRVHGGPLDGVTGVFMQVRGKRNRRLVITLDGLLSLSVEVHPNLIEIL